MKVIVSKAKVSDIDAMIEVEHLAWSSPGENIEASREKLLSRVTSCDGDQVASIATIGGKAAGSQYAFCFEWDGNLSSLTSWDELTAEGWTGKVHQFDGNTGFLVGVGVVPEFRGAKFAHNLRWSGNYKVSELLVGRTLDELFIQKGVSRVIGNARVPWFHKCPHLTIEEYCALRNADGKLFDPVLRFHERMGAKILKPVPFAMEDAESLDAGCWVLYPQIFQG